MLKLTVTAVSSAWLRLTVNTTSSPSVASPPLSETAALSLSMIVPVAVARSSSRLTPAGRLTAVIVAVKVSWSSITVLSIVVTATVALVRPARIATFMLFHPA